MKELAQEQDGAAARLDRRASGLSPVTRSDILEAALTLFATRGYYGTSLKDVAHAVGLRAPSLYNHIEAKSDLLVEIVFETLAHVGAELEEAIEAHVDLHDRLYAATYAYALRHAVHRREALVVNQDARHLPEHDLSRAQSLRRFQERRFRQIISDGVDSGLFDVPSAKLASFAIREMCVSAARWFHEGGDFTAEDVARNFATQAVRMVQGPIR
ncbi:TetR family transcriptional regulator [Nocardioides sp.]|uniref:TetR/AcrR family transcriptional regulator n=1 Tax=Nocardioides sp. TaxID=35761 RepID=UPI002608A4ED|nr:TetR family transcriptional regulator [Nocardioides sp.]MCW2736258.1 regulatory protein TetR [Nocardioides sp.]